MPAVSKKNGKKKQPEQVDETQGLPVTYPVLRIAACWVGEGEVVTVDDDGNEVIVKMKGVGPVTREMAEVWLGWETEAQYTKRVMAMTPDEREAQGVKRDCKEEEAVYSDITLLDHNKERIKCHNNLLNRKFVRDTADAISQDILQRNYAGPGNFPGETVNGEPLIIGRTGQTISCQHRLIGLILACQRWAKEQSHWKEHGWETEPVLETMVVFGCSESPKIVQTIDNVRTRKEEDVLFTSGYFRNVASAVDRSRCCKMLALADEVLWKRTAQEAIDKWNEHRTHSVAQDFLDRHPRLERCVRYILKVDQKTSLAELRLKTQDCAAWLYLMGASNSDRQKYIDPNSGKPPSERSMNWDNWDKAEDFWMRLGNVEQIEEPTYPIIQALRALVDVNTGKVATNQEKAEVICRGWLKFASGEPFTWEDIAIKDNEYDKKNENGWTLIERSNFGGIDIGDKKSKVNKSKKDNEPEFTEEQKAAQVEEARQIRLEEIRKKQEALVVDQKPVIPPPLLLNGKVMPNIDTVVEQAAANTKGMAAGNAAQAAKNATTKPRVIIRGGTNK